MIKRTTIAAAVLAAATVTAAWAQQAVRVNGTIAAIDGAVLTVKGRDGAEQKVSLTGNASVIGVAKGTLADIKPNAFVGVGAMPQPDGSQRAIRVVIFAEAQRGLGEGHRPWDRPNSTMTNATVAQKVASVEGDVLTVKYKDGEKKIVVPPDAVILVNTVSDRSELKPGAAVGVTRAVKRADGTLEADRINVGRGGVRP